MYVLPHDLEREAFPHAHGGDELAVLVRVIPFTVRGLAVAERERRPKVNLFTSGEKSNKQTYKQTYKHT